MPICTSLLFCPGRIRKSNRNPLNPNPCRRNDTTRKQNCPNPHLCVGPVHNNVLILSCNKKQNQTGWLARILAASLSESSIESKKFIRNHCFLFRTPRRNPTIGMSRGFKIRTATACAVIGKCTRCTMATYHCVDSTRHHSHTLTTHTAAASRDCRYNNMFERRKSAELSDRKTHIGLTDDSYRE
jgi:hypothetical protein